MMPMHIPLPKVKPAKLVKLAPIIEPESLEQLSQIWHKIAPLKDAIQALHVTLKTIGYEIACQTFRNNPFLKAKYEAITKLFQQFKEKELAFKILYHKANLVARFSDGSLSSVSTTPFNIETSYHLYMELGVLPAESKSTSKKSVKEMWESFYTKRKEIKKEYPSEFALYKKLYDKAVETIEQLTTYKDEIEPIYELFKQRVSELEGSNSSLNERKAELGRLMAHYESLKSTIHCFKPAGLEQLDHGKFNDAYSVWRQQIDEESAAIDAGLQEELHDLALEEMAGSSLEEPLTVRKLAIYQQKDQELESLKRKCEEKLVNVHEKSTRILKLLLFWVVILIALFVELFWSSLKTMNFFPIFTSSFIKVNLFGLVIALLGLCYIKYIDKNKRDEEFSRIEFFGACFDVAYLLYLIILMATVTTRMNAVFDHFPNTDAQSIHHNITYAFFVIYLFFALAISSIKMTWRFVWLIIYTFLMTYLNHSGI